MIVCQFKPVQGLALLIRQDLSFREFQRRFDVIQQNVPNYCKRLDVVTCLNLMEKRYLYTHKYEYSGSESSV